MPNIFANTDGISVGVALCISDVQNVSDLVSVSSPSSLVGFPVFKFKEHGDDGVT